MAIEIDDAFRSHRRLLFDVSYRITGSIDDAEEIVQETFARAIAAPPTQASTALRRWLVRVTTNLSIDALRRRRRKVYSGPWLPFPLETGRIGPAVAGGVESPDAYAARSDAPDARFALAESAEFAFLIALEQLTPRQRAVLVLCDVFDHSTIEAAELLDMTGANVRVTLHRARRVLESARADAPMEARKKSKVDRNVDSAPCEPDGEAVLRELVRGLFAHDIEALTRLLAEDVHAVTDSGGRYTAVGKPVAGRDAVIRLLTRVVQQRGRYARVQERSVNGAAALLIEFSHTVRRQAPCMVVRCEAAADGRIVELHVLVGPEKLGSLLGGESTDAPA